MASPQFESPVAASAAEIWTDAFEEMCQRMASCFVQVQTRQRAQAYVRGLLSPVERKNGWQLAEEAGETTPYAMQYLLDRAVLGRWGTASSCAMRCAGMWRRCLGRAMPCWSSMKRVF